MTTSDDERDNIISRVQNHAKAVIESLQLSGTPPEIPEDFTPLEVRLVRVALWEYARRSGQKIPELPAELAGISASNLRNARHELPMGVEDSALDEKPLDWDDAEEIALGGNDGPIS